ncbi:unnamed protein product [Parnassius apollo]|uniref:(apollo) hypothetical protein n=1 Tax=Parnassius apollo TaxID=110799 RepID=A0A8S3X0G6_PARAO|nr:unnamed protein product [Parnassius apollo]
MNQMDPEREKPPHQQSIIQPRQNILYGKNHHKWSTKPRDPRTHTAARDVLHIVPGPTGRAEELSQPKDLFYLFVKEEMIDFIVQYTNEK